MTITTPTGQMFYLAIDAAEELRKDITAAILKIRAQRREDARRDPGELLAFLDRPRQRKRAKRDAGKAAK